MRVENRMLAQLVTAATLTATLALPAVAGATPDTGGPAYAQIAAYADIVTNQPVTVDIDGEQVPWTFDMDVLIRLKECETGTLGWHERGPSIFLGAHQWVAATWDAYGGQYAPTPMAATIAEQFQAVRNNVAAHGETFSQFPGCRRKLGLA